VHRRLKSMPKRVVKNQAEDAPHPLEVATREKERTRLLLEETTLFKEKRDLDKKLEVYTRHKLQYKVQVSHTIRTRATECDVVCSEWVVGCWGAGCWVLGVGQAKRSDRDLQARPDQLSGPATDRVRSGGVVVCGVWCVWMICLSHTNTHTHTHTHACHTHNTHTTHYTYRHYHTPTH
jgi:hypothetical protein